ncbi:MAG TPA: START domain-containing protein [Mucilaginibacter sp.]|jgi:ribosome-associated toxin RatA of RatAB toxin-antitoxin module|nr:START domain-containing protein [Mucilaginibacter sp.]
MKHKLILVLLLLTGFKLARAQEEWTFSSEKEGIKIYTDKASNLRVKPVKVECTFNATASQLTAILMDIKAYPEWVYHTKQSTVIKQVSPEELYYYSEVSVPWPAQNRDLVAHVTVSQNPETKVVTFEAPSVQGMVPAKEGLFRINHSKGKWVITPVGSNQVKVVYVLQIDPDGSAPTWLINMFATEGPMQSFRNLKKQLQKPAYKNVSLPYIKN